MDRPRPGEQESLRSPLVTQFTLKRDLLGSGDPTHTKIRTIGFVEGGGVTAAWSLGVMSELEDQGYKGVFDSQYGYSAGALIAAVSVSGQLKEAIDLIWSGKLTEGIASVRNFFLGKDIMSMSHLDTVLRDVLKLDIDAIRNSRTHLHIGVTDDKGKGHFLDAKNPRIDIVRALVASCALPVGYNKHVNVDGKKYSDGGIGWGVPIDYMLEHEAAEGVEPNLLGVINKPHQERKSPHFLRTAYSRNVVGRYFSREFHHAYKRVVEEWNHSLFHHRKDIPAHIEMVAPQFPIPEFNRSIPHLMNIYGQGRNAVQRMGFSRGAGN